MEGGKAMQMEEQHKFQTSLKVVGVRGGSGCERRC